MGAGVLAVRHESGAYRNTEPKPCEGFSLKGPVMASTGYLGFHASESTLRGGFVSGTSHGFLPADNPQPGRWQCSAALRNFTLHSTTSFSGTACGILTQHSKVTAC